MVPIAPTPPPAPPAPPPGSNNPPVITGTSPSGSTFSVPQNNLQAFTANVSDADGNLLGLSWFVEGVEEQSKGLQGGSGSDTFSFQFSSQGTFLVEVVVTDEKGDTVSTTWTVAVTQAVVPTPISSFTTGDLNQDGKVNILDVSILLSHCGKTSAISLQKADISAGFNNGSTGRVDIFDANKLMANWTG